MVVRSENRPHVPPSHGGEGIFSGAAANSNSRLRILAPAVVTCSVGCSGGVWKLVRRSRVSDDLRAGRRRARQPAIGGGARDRRWRVGGGVRRSTVGGGAQDRIWTRRRARAGDGLAARDRAATGERARRRRDPTTARRTSSTLSLTLPASSSFGY